MSTYHRDQAPHVLEKKLGFSNRRGWEMRSINQPSQVGYNRSGSIFWLTLALTPTPILNFNCPMKCLTLSYGRLFKVCIYKNIMKSIKCLRTLKQYRSFLIAFGFVYVVGNITFKANAWKRERNYIELSLVQFSSILEHYVFGPHKDLRHHHHFVQIYVTILQ